MNWNKIQKILIFLIFTIGICPAINAQNGSITIDISTFSFQSTEGNYPYLKYRVDPIRIFTKSGLQVGGTNTSVLRIYSGVAPETKHIVNLPMISSQVIDGSNLDAFDLQTGNSLLVEQQVYAGTIFPTVYTDLVGYTSPYHKISLTSFAANGNTNYTYRRSITGADSNGNNIPFPYHFQFISSYDLDAIQPDLEFRTMQDSIRSEFCEGEYFKVKANYKGPFHNGLFVWEINNGSGWNYLKLGGETIVRRAIGSGVRYRARLSTFGGRYGVSDFSNPNRYAQTAVIPGTNSSILRVRHKIDNFSHVVQEVCPMGDLGKISVTSMTGARNGENYSVVLNDENEDYIDDIQIINYQPDYFANNSVSFEDLPADRKSVV